MLEGYRYMVHFKACPRCKGDMHRIEDRWGKYIQCLQCGSVTDLRPEPIKVPRIWGPQKPGRPRKNKASRDAA